MNKFTKQCVAAFASLAMAGTLCVAGAVVANSSAWAVDNNCNAGAPWSTECADQKGTITIHKKDSSNSNAGLNGAKFTIKKVSKIGSGNDDTMDKNYNLKTKEGWIKLAAKVNKLNQWIIDNGNNTSAGNRAADTFSVTFNQTAFNNSESKEVQTAHDTTLNEDGIAKFDQLSIGLYYVYESGVPEGYTPDFVPFFVAVPQITREKKTSGQGYNTNNTYIYDVSVSPKNRNVQNDVTKDALTGKIVGAGDTLPYVITAKVTLPTDPTKDTNGKFETKNLTGFAVFDDAWIAAYDDLDASKISPTVTVGLWDSTAGSNKFKTDSGATASLIKDTDYTLTVEDSNIDKETTGSKNATRKRILLKFNDSGLGKIVGKFGTGANANASTDVRVQVKLNLKLKSDLKTVGSDNKLANKYGFVPGHKPGAPDTDVTGKTTETEFRKFHIFKYDGTTEKGTGATDGRKALKGAEFKAFADKTEAEKCAKDPDGNTNNVSNCSAALKGFADPTGTTPGDNGSITTTGSNGKTTDYVAKVTNDNSKIYLVEVKAPEGYTRSEQAYEVNLESKSSTDTNAVLEYEVPNVPDNQGEFWFHLPKTGAAGVIIFALAGVCLVCLGIFLFMSNRKKEEEQQAA